MKAILAGNILLSGVCGVFLTGCSTVVNSHLQKEDMMTAYENGNNAEVMQEIEYKLREPRWYNSSVVNTGDEVMWRLEAGSMNFHQGKFDECIKQLKIAERLIGEYDDRAMLSARDVGAEAGMALTNLNTLPYRGFCRDRLALSIYKSLAYLGTGSESSFRAQLRRLRYEQKKVQDDYREFFEAEKAEMTAAKKRNPDAAEKTEKTAGEMQLANDPKNAEFCAGLEEVKKIANKGYGNFLNPATIFLSGLGSVRDGNFDNARIDFKRLYEAMPQNPMCRQYYVSVLKKAGRDVPAELKNVKPFDFPLENDCVYVIFANGRGAAFKQIAVYFPIMTAWPMCEFYIAPFEKLQALADGKRYHSMILADMDGVIAQEFNERLPGMITRIVLSTLIKESAYYGGLIAIQQSNMHPIAKLIAWCSVAIGGAAYRAAMNTADTRTWEILPKEFQLTQFPMPENREISISLIGNGTVARMVKIPGDCRSAIVFVSAPSSQNINCHVLSIKSK